MLDAQQAGTLLTSEHPPSVTRTGEAPLVGHIRLFFFPTHFAILIQNVK